MKRWTIFAVLALLATSSLAQPMRYQEGQHYNVIEPAQPTNDASKVEVVEVFGYLCPHCYRFQANIEPWLEEKPELVEFRRIPVVFQRPWEPLARAYYTADALGILDQSHMALFEALHKERKNLRTPEHLAEFHSQFGVEQDEFLKTSKSFTVDTKMRQGAAQAQRYGVTGTPSIIVNGKYIVTAGMPGHRNYQDMMDVVEHLVDSELARVQQGEATAGTEIAVETE